MKTLKDFALAIAVVLVGASIGVACAVDGIMERSDRAPAECWCPQDCE